MSKKVKNDNKIRELTTAAMKDLGSMIDVNTVVGKPFTMPDGSTVIPVTKVTMGFMTGGGEYGEVKTIKSSDAPLRAGAERSFRLNPSDFCSAKIKE